MMRRFVLLAVGSLLLAGCGGRTSIVVGTVSVGGTPLAAGTVAIEDARGEVRLGEIAGGQFRVEGIPRGTARLAVIPGVADPEAKDPSRKFGQFGRARAKFDKPLAVVPKDYLEPRTSPFTANLDRSTVEVTLNVP